MWLKPDFLNTPDGFSKYVKLLINHRGWKLSHALLLFHRSLIIKACKIFVILHAALCDTLTREFQWKKNRKRNCEIHMGKCDCSFGRQFSKFQFGLQRKQRSLFVTHWYVWRGRNAVEKVNVLTSGWRLYNAGDTRLMRVSWHYCLQNMWPSFTIQQASPSVRTTSWANLPSDVTPREGSQSI